MKVLLIKPETVGIFCYTNQVEHEPLEMEYVKSALSLAGHEAYIYDRRYDLTPLRKKLKEDKPNAVCITGYITQQDLMKKITNRIKEIDPSVYVVIGGSNAEINYMNYFDCAVDYIYHLSGLTNLVKLMDFLDGRDVGKREDIDGICYREEGEWKVNKKVVESPTDLPTADRTFFYDNIKRFGYLKFRPLALVKNSYSCKKKCNFCFCTNRNSGNYACRSAADIVDEIRTLKVDNIHITDDDFLVDREYLLEFVSLLRKYDVHKKFLIYGRADFIAENEDVIRELADVGLSLVMVGLEATSNMELDSYNKKTSVFQNEECVRILDKYNIICAGLFIVHPQMTKEDFKHLYKWIECRNIIPTISIFTPMQGSAMYKQYEDKLVIKDVTKQDLFHCLLKPEHMGRLKFTWMYYQLSLSLAWKKRHADLYSSINFFEAFGYILKVMGIKIKRLVSF